MVVITTMMENTPTLTPSRVSAERSLCAAMEFAAIRKLSFSSSSANSMKCGLDGWSSLIAQCLHGVHPRRAPRREKPRCKAGQQRDQYRQAHHGQRKIHRECQFG